MCELSHTPANAEYKCFQNANINTLVEVHCPLSLSILNVQVIIILVACTVPKVKEILYRSPLDFVHRSINITGTRVKEMLIHLMVGS